MLTITGNGHLTSDPKMRRVEGGHPVVTLSVESVRRNQGAEPINVDLILWWSQAEAAAESLRKGQAVSFSGRFEPRVDPGQCEAIYEVHNVTLEHGPPALREAVEKPSASPEKKAVR